MDDLSGLEWSASSKPATKAPTGTGNYYPSLRPTPPPTQTRSSPLSSHVSTTSKPSALAPPKSSTPDSFSNLVSFGSSKTQTLTLQEQQEKLQADKQRKEEEKRKQYETQFGSSQLWDGLGSRGQSQASTPAITSRVGTPAAQPLPSNFARPTSPPTNSNGADNGDSDLFAAFNADTKVDKSSHYPPPSTTSSSSNTTSFGTNKGLDLSKPQAWEEKSGSLAGFEDDDDPFGLNDMKPRRSAPAPIQTADEDDFLGDLGKPVEEVRRHAPSTKTPSPVHEARSDSEDPWNKAVAELVDMGFSAEQAQQALTESGSGLDIQAAVGWILNDAHRQAKAKQQSRNPSRNNTPSNGERRTSSREAQNRENNPARMRDEGRDRSQARRPKSHSPANGEVDLSKPQPQLVAIFSKRPIHSGKRPKRRCKKLLLNFSKRQIPSQPKMDA